MQKRDPHSVISTEQDSSSQREQTLPKPKTDPSKHKTELCKTFSEMGSCPYGKKCKFAHGHRELLASSAPTPHKRTKCKGFWGKGWCSYGLRCQFVHSWTEWEDSAALNGLGACCNYSCTGSKLMRLLRQ